MLVDLANEPQYSEDITNLTEIISSQGSKHVVLNLNEVSFLNSSNLAKLLRLRKKVTASGSRLILCNLNNHVWGTFLVTGLDKIFDFSEDQATALATLQVTQTGRS
jgi:stage II sporulation protein AA (anti-sigma F factor antagonist)